MIPGLATDHQGDTAEPNDGGTAVSSNLTVPGLAEGDGDGDNGAALPNLDLWTTNTKQLGDIHDSDLHNYLNDDVALQCEMNYDDMENY